MSVVAGCGRSCGGGRGYGVQIASCSVGARVSKAECGRIVPTQWTHSAVASTGGVDVLTTRSLVTNELGLVQRVQRLGQGSPVGMDLYCAPRSQAMHQAHQVGSLTSSLPDGHSQCVKGQVGVQAGGCLPADDSPRVHVGDEGDVDSPPRKYEHN